MAIQKVTRVNNYQRSLPSDIDQVIGKLNLLLIDIFSKIRAFFNEFFQRSFNIYKDFFKDVDPLAKKFSYDLKLRLYKCFQRKTTQKEHLLKKIDSENLILPKDIAKVLGKFNLLIIDIFSNLRAFFKVFFKRLKTISYKGFFKNTEITYLKFSYETKIKLYNYSKNIKLPQTQQEQEDISSLLETTRKERVESTSSKSNKKTYTVITVLGLVILAYLMYPYRNVWIAQINSNAFTRRFFWMFNKTTPMCIEDLYAPGKAGGCPTLISAREISIDCRGLDPCECEALCYGKVKI